MVKMLNYPYQLVILIFPSTVGEVDFGVYGILLDISVPKDPISTGVVSRE